MVALTPLIVVSLAGISAAITQSLNPQGVSSNSEELGNSQTPNIVAREPAVFPRSEEDEEKAFRENIIALEGPTAKFGFKLQDDPEFFKKMIANPDPAKVTVEEAIALKEYQERGPIPFFLLHHDSLSGVPVEMRQMTVKEAIAHQNDFPLRVIDMLFDRASGPLEPFMILVREKTPTEEKKSRSTRSEGTSSPEGWYTTDAKYHPPNPIHTPSPEFKYWFPPPECFCALHHTTKENCPSWFYYDTKEPLGSAIMLAALALVAAPTPVPSQEKRCPGNMMLDRKPIEWVKVASTSIRAPATKTVEGGYASATYFTTLSTHVATHLPEPLVGWPMDPKNRIKAPPGILGKRALVEDLEIPEPLRDSHWAASISPRTPAPISISRTEKVLDSLTLLDSRVKALNTAITDYTSGFRAAAPIQTAIQSLHSASLNTNDDSLLLPPLNAEDSKKIVDYIRDNIVVNILASVKAMQEKTEEFKKAKLGAVVIVTLKSLREDYDRPSMVLAGKIVKEDMDTAKGLLTTVDEAILEGIKGFEE